MNDISMQDERIGNEIAKIKQQLKNCYRDVSDRTGMMNDMGRLEVKPWMKKKHFDLARRMKELQTASDAMRLL